MDSNHRIPVTVYERPHGHTHEEYITADRITDKHYAAWQKYDEAGFFIGVEDIGTQGHAIYFSDKTTKYDAEIIITPDAKELLPHILNQLLTFDVVTARAYITKLEQELEGIDEDDQREPAF